MQPFRYAQRPQQPFQEAGAEAHAQCTISFKLELDTRRIYTGMYLLDTCQSIMVLPSVIVVVPSLTTLVICGPDLQENRMEGKHGRVHRA